MGLYDFLTIFLLCITVIIVSYFKFRKPPVVNVTPDGKCQHVWKIHDTRRVNCHNGETYTRYHMICTKCGAMECKDMH